MRSRIVYRASEPNPLNLREIIIRRNAEWDVYVVQFFTDGEYHHEADYETPDWDDAHGTATFWLKGVTQ